MLKLLAVLAVSATSLFNIDREIFTGAWAGGVVESIDQDHTYLRFDDDHKGRFVWVTSGTATVDFEFGPDDISKPEGYIEIRKSFDDWGVKIVLSGWTSPEDRGAGMLMGSMYMYQASGDQPQLFNTIFLRLRPVGAPTGGTDIDEGDLDKLHQRYSSEAGES